MEANGANDAAIDMGIHLANRARHFPPTALLAYAGEEIAFSADGTQIVAHGKDFLTLWNELKASGVDPQTCVWSSVPPPGEESSW